MLLLLDLAQNHLLQRLVLQLYDAVQFTQLLLVVFAIATLGARAPGELIVIGLLLDDWQFGAVQRWQLHPWLLPKGQVPAERRVLHRLMVRSVSIVVLAAELLEGPSSQPAVQRSQLLWGHLLGF